MQRTSPPPGHSEQHSLNREEELRVRSSIGTKTDLSLTVLQDSGLHRRRFAKAGHRFARGPAAVIVPGDNIAGMELHLLLGAGDDIGGLCCWRSQHPSPGVSHLQKKSDSCRKRGGLPGRLAAALRGRWSHSASGFWRSVDGILEREDHFPEKDGGAHFIGRGHYPDACTGEGV